jgi:hypothetical protein
LYFPWGFDPPAVPHSRLPRDQFGVVRARNNIMATQAFEARINQATADATRITTDRIASGILTRQARKMYDTHKQKIINNYRQNNLARLQGACTRSELRDEVTTKFRNLAENLENAKATIIASKHQASGETEGRGPQDAWQLLLVDETAYRGRPLACSSELAMSLSISQGLVDPLSITLLAYRMGGAVTAVLIAPQAHQWKLPEQFESAIGVESFHVESGGFSMFSDHRMTLVWDEHGGKARSVLGSHRVYLGSEDAQSHVLQTSTLPEAEQVAMPSTMLYDSTHATLMHECLKKDVVRHSISLDFCL